MITLYGTTSDGTSIPIEVTDQGKLVVDTSSLSGYIKQGDDIDAGTITAEGDVSTKGSISARASLQVGPVNQSYISDYGVFLKDTGNASASNFNLKLDTNGIGYFSLGVRTGAVNTNDGSKAGVNTNPSGSIDIQRADGAGGKVLSVWGGKTESAYISSNGAISTQGTITAASNKAGFTSDGELFFWSRGARYKAVVQAGNVMAEEYPITTAIKEVIDGRIEGKQEPRI